MSKTQRVIHLSRAFGVHIDGRNEAVELNAGRNLVDAEVAEHPFVKAHLTEEPQEHDSVTAAALESARLRIADLEGEIVKRDEAGKTLADLLETTNDELQAMTKERDELKSINAALSMTAPTGDTKSSKSGK